MGSFDPSRKLPFLRHPHGTALFKVVVFIQCGLAFPFWRTYRKEFRNVQGFQVFYGLNDNFNYRVKCFPPAYAYLNTLRKLSNVCVAIKLGRTHMYKTPQDSLLENAKKPVFQVALTH